MWVYYCFSNLLDRQMLGSSHKRSISQDTTFKDLLHSTCRSLDHVYTILCARNVYILVFHCQVRDCLKSWCVGQYLYQLGTIDRVICEERILSKNMSPWPVSKSVGHFLDLWLIWEGQPIVDGATIGPGVYKKTNWASQKQASKPYPYMASTSAPAFKLLHWASGLASSVVLCDEKL